MDTKELAAKTLEALNELLTLEIVTTIGAMTIAVEDNSKDIVFRDLAPQASAITRINIATGDIWSNRTPPDPTGGIDIGDYHDKMVEKSQAIIERNVRLIAEVIDKLRAAG